MYLWNTGFNAFGYMPCSGIVRSLDSSFEEKEILLNKYFTILSYCYPCHKPVSCKCTDLYLYSLSLICSIISLLLPEPHWFGFSRFAVHLNLGSGMPLTLFFQLTIYLLFFVNNYKFFHIFLFLPDAIGILIRISLKLLIIVIFSYIHVGYHLHF